ncbi:hypothetical protein IJJ39_00935 [Candidatus Saccharibacteria bacterium]|nr:hypothetical protein [Candidatus Saccharibacteria bacterium]
MEPNQMGAAGQPMPNQQIPNQPMQEPMQAGQPAMQAMSVEEQMTMAMQEPMQDMNQVVEPAPVMEAPKKSGHGMLIGMILAIVVAIAGVAFGVIMMLNGNNTSADYEKQISSLKATNANLQDQLSEFEALNGDEALKLLQDAVASQSLPYSIQYANVYAKYNGDDDVTAYWVKYLPVNVPEGVAVASDIIFTMSEDGNWEFALPGFTSFTEELLQNYVLLDGSEIVVAPVTPAPAPAPEETPAE